MKKVLKIAFTCMSLMCAAGVGMGITYAAYKAPDENNSIQFGEMTGSDHNFQTLSYYFAGGDGTEGTPFLIKNATHLRNFSKLWNMGAMDAASYVSLATSFQFEGDAIEPIGTSSIPFTGVFNGNDYLITGLKVSTSTNTFVGMFGVVGTDTRTGTVHNLVLAGPSVTYTGSSNVKIGIIAGSKNTTAGHASIIQNIEIYGGTNDFNKVRAHLRSGGTPASGNAIVGAGGSENCGFVSSLSSAPTYTSTYVYTSLTAKNTDYNLWLNGTTVVNS